MLIENIPLIHKIGFGSAGNVTARVARFSLAAKIANDDDLVCAPSVSARDHPAHGVALPSFTLSYRDVEDLLAERGLDVSYESVRRWVLKFGPLFARELRHRRHRPTSQWRLDEMAVRLCHVAAWSSAKVWRLKEQSGRCDRRPPRVHSRSTKRVMGLG